jgi:hypothetical protein
VFGDRGRVHERARDHGFAALATAIDGGATRPRIDARARADAWWFGAV